MSVEATYQVKGMSCGGCAKKVRGKLEQLPGWVSADITPKAGVVRLTTEEALPEDQVRDAVQAAGFTYVGVLV
jgi:aspartate aminotransferase